MLYVHAHAMPLLRQSKTKRRPSTVDEPESEQEYVDIVDDDVIMSVPSAPHKTSKVCPALCASPWGREHQCVLCVYVAWRDMGRIWRQVCHVIMSEHHVHATPMSGSKTSAYQ